MCRPVSFLLVMGLFAGGCGKQSALVPVDGTVTLDGEPVTGMAITFTPQGEMEGSGALGYVGDDGRFTLTDPRGGAGAYVGTYRISFYPAPAAKLTDADDPGGVQTMRRNPGLPAIYMGNESPVLATVPEGGGTVEVQLTKTGQGATAKTSPRSAAK